MKTTTILLIVGVAIFVYLLYQSGVFSKIQTAILPTNTTSGGSQLRELIGQDPGFTGGY